MFTSRRIGRSAIAATLASITLGVGSLAAALPAHAATAPVIREGADVDVRRFTAVSNNGAIVLAEGRFLTVRQVGVKEIANLSAKANLSELPLASTLSGDGKVAYIARKTLSGSAQIIRVAAINGWTPQVVGDLPSDPSQLLIGSTDKTLNLSTNDDGSRAAAVYTRGFSRPTLAVINPAAKVKVQVLDYTVEIAGNRKPGVPMGASMTGSGVTTRLSVLDYQQPTWSAIGWTVDTSIWNQRTFTNAECAGGARLFGSTVVCAGWSTGQPLFTYDTATRKSMMQKAKDVLNPVAASGSSVLARVQVGTTSISNFVLINMATGTRTAVLSDVGYSGGFVSSNGRAVTAQKLLNTNTYPYLTNRNLTIAY